MIEKGRIEEEGLYFINFLYFILYHVIYITYYVTYVYIIFSEKYLCETVICITYNLPMLLAPKGRTTSFPHLNVVLPI